VADDLGQIDWPLLMLELVGIHERLMLPDPTPQQEVIRRQVAGLMRNIQPLADRETAVPDLSCLVSATVIALLEAERLLLAEPDVEDVADILCTAMQVLEILATKHYNTDLN